MERQPSPEIDDELFNEVYGKEYTGPPRPTGNSGTVNEANKRPLDDPHSAENDEPPDPNAVPTDFTSREAKFWEAKAKATERNWKKRKEEEMICIYCGETGHFSQGCPSTLGANRRTFSEKVAARDKQVRALFSDKVISRIEKDIGCKIEMDEKFLTVIGKDRLILSQGVNAVHKIIQDGKNKNPASSHRTISKSPVRSPADSHYRRSESLKSHSSPRNSSRFHGRAYNQERVVEDRVRDDLPKFSRDSPHAYGNAGSRGQSVRSRSPPRSNFRRDPVNSFDGHNHISEVHRSNSWSLERRGTDLPSEQRFDFPSCPQTLEELEMEFKKEVMEIERIRAKEEDEESYKHCECIRELGETYAKKLALLRGMHLKQWEEFLQLDIHRRQQSRFNAYNQQVYQDYNQSSRDAQFAGTNNLPMDSRSRHPFPNEDYPTSRPSDLYGDFQRQRPEDFGRAYGRY